MRFVGLCVIFAACGGSSPAGADAPPGAPDAGEPGIDAAPAMPITAPAETWTFVPLDGMQCADGSATGVGVNLTTKSQDVMVFFEGGGACWDSLTCFSIMSAIHITGGYDASAFAADEPALAATWIFQRGDATNPFANASWIFVPYCTGDLHAGAKVATISTSNGDKTVHFVGRPNASIVLERAAATRLTAANVWIMGASAGGYATAFDYDLAAAVWPAAKVSALDDSGPLISADATTWSSMLAAWGPIYPASCTGCAGDLGAMAGALRGELVAGGRYGLMQNTADATIESFLQIPTQTMTTEIDAAAQAMVGSGDEAAFLIASSSHTLIETPAVTTVGGVSVKQWVTQWATGDAAWGNDGP